MRITEVITEAGIIDAVKAAQKSYATGYQKGFDKVDRVLNPKRWGSGADSEQDNSAIKDALEKVIAGRRIYDADQQALISAAKSVQAGKIETKLNPQQLAAILKSVAQQKPADQQQLAQLKQFSQEI